MLARRGHCVVAPGLKPRALEPLAKEIESNAGSKFAVPDTGSWPLARVPTSSFRWSVLDMRIKRRGLGPDVVRASTIAFTAMIEHVQATRAVQCVGSQAVKDVDGAEV